MAHRTVLAQLRQSERELESQLAKLRLQIRKAERGENTRIKDANKYIARTLRTIGRANKEQEKLREKELVKLERFLGESFESLGEAREALGKQTRKATKREKLAEALRLKSRGGERNVRYAEKLEREAMGRTLDPNKPKYTIRQLSAFENQQVIEFLTDKKTFQKVGLDYLKENERITVSVPYKYIGTDGREHTGYGIGRKMFRSWDDLQRYIRVQYFSESPGTEEWLGHIEIIKFPNGYQYALEKGRQTDARRDRKKAVKKMFTNRIKEAKKKARIGAEKRVTKERAKVKELKRQLKGRK